jgi:tetratricopeptide (TPR) repeat protein
VSFGGHKLGNPSNNEVRSALERVVTSPVFRSSPQLAAFLKFIVESALAGHTEDIKGYTIAIKALGRGEDFNPKTDAIVRVEAGRLRRALATYYSDAGAHDPIGIEIPARGYIPTFHRRDVEKPPRKPVDVGGKLRTLASRVALTSRPYAAAIVLLILGAATYWGVETWFLGNDANRSSFVTASVLDPQSLARWRGRPIGPVIAMSPTSTSGSPTPPTITAASLFDRLRNTFARFDDVTIVSDAPADGTTAPAQTAFAPDYKFASEIEYNPDSTLSLTFRVVDASDGTIAWTRSYDRLRIGDDPRVVKYPIVREVAATLFQPFGVIKARDRGKLASARIADPRYRCVLQALDYWRSFDLTIHAEARNCLERAIAGDPTFASGYALLARIYLREYQFGAGDQPSDPAMLDTALDLVKRAIELKPHSARNYSMLLDVQMTRGAVEEALAAGDTALKLNPDDPTVSIAYGSQLIALGEVEKGLALLQGSPGDSVHQTRLEFALFLAAYLKDNLAEAGLHADRLSNKTFSLGHMARALIGYQRGDKAAARQAYERLVALAPAWHTNAPAELKKLFPSPKVADRLLADFNEVSAVPVN